MNPTEIGSTELHVQYVAYANEAAFVMRFEIEREGGGLAGETASFPTQQTRTIDLARLYFGGQPLEVGEKVWGRMRPVLLERSRNGPSVIYAANGHTATFRVHGILVSYTISRM